MFWDLWFPVQLFGGTGSSQRELAKQCIDIRHPQHCCLSLLLLKILSCSWSSCHILLSLSFLASSLVIKTFIQTNMTHWMDLHWMSKIQSYSNIDHQAIDGNTSFWLIASMRNLCHRSFHRRMKSQGYEWRQKAKVRLIHLVGTHRGTL